MMNYPQEFNSNTTTKNEMIMSCLFGAVVLAAGIVNTFWGQPAGFGIFLILLSSFYFLPFNILLKKLTGIIIPEIMLIRIILGIFIIWAVLGVGNLFDKIELMSMNL